MIVQTAGDSLRLITQPDHAALARRIMERWQAGGFARARRRTSILHAIQEHDNGWRELDAAPIVDSATGRIADFISAPAELRRPVWPRGVLRLADDPWAAALVAQHAIHIYDSWRSDSGWSSFFGELERLRAHFLAQTTLTPDELLSDYAFVRNGDLISLVFCNQWTDGRDGHGCTIEWRDSSVVIRPDPFAGASFAISISAREIPNRTYRDAADAVGEWKNAQVVEIKGTVSGA